MNISVQGSTQCEKMEMMHILQSSIDITKSKWHISRSNKDPDIAVISI